MDLAGPWAAALPSGAVRLAPEPTGKPAEPNRVECPSVTCPRAFVGDDAGEQCVAHVLDVHGAVRLAPQDEAHEPSFHGMPGDPTKGELLTENAHQAADLSTLRAELARVNGVANGLVDDLEREQTKRFNTQGDLSALRADNERLSGLRAKLADVLAELDVTRRELEEARQGESDEANAYRLRKKRSDEQAKTIERLQADNEQQGAEIRRLHDMLGQGQ